MWIGYARVSTVDQKLSIQLEALEAEGCTIISNDHGVCVDKYQREGLNSALNRLSFGGALVVWKLDRLGRSLGSLCRLIDYMGKRASVLSA